jgi:hypothetical protein
MADDLSWQGTLQIEQAGTLNAVRFITKNIVAVLDRENRAAEWSNQYLVLPLDTPISVLAGEQIHLGFSYRAGDPVHALSSSLAVNRESSATPLHRAA